MARMETRFSMPDPGDDDAQALRVLRVLRAIRGHIKDGAKLHVQLLDDLYEILAIVEGISHRVAWTTIDLFWDGLRLLHPLDPESSYRYVTFNPLRGIEVPALTAGPTSIRSARAWTTWRFVSMPRSSHLARKPTASARRRAADRRGPPGRTIRWWGRSPGPGRPDVAIANVTRGPAPREALLARALVEAGRHARGGLRCGGTADAARRSLRRSARCLPPPVSCWLGLMETCGDASSSEAMPPSWNCSSCSPRKARAPDCYLSGKPVINEDLAMATGRWPRVRASGARGAGFHSVHALPMRLRGTVIEPPTCSTWKPGEMDGGRCGSRQALADVATIRHPPGNRAALEAQVVNQQRQHALNSRVIIEQAKGMGRRERRARHGPGVHGLGATMPATTTFASSVLAEAVYRRLPGPRQRWTRVPRPKAGLKPS